MLKQIESRFWVNGYSKREWGYQLALGSKLLGYGVVLFLVGGMSKINIYKIVK
jgi:hypothetical protein